VVGKLVHAALRHWRFEEQGMEPFLRPHALEMGVVDEGEIHNAVSRTQRLLRRFRAHPLWAEMDGAQRWHEVPFSIEDGGQIKRGVIDLLYRAGGVWKIAEFKTDRPRPGVTLTTHIQNEEYDKQVHRYKRAVRLQCGVEAEATIVFLDVDAGIAIVPIPVPAPATSTAT
jgi:ATP-dependent exoDNAse (exonuclease V) beta subunit